MWATSIAGIIPLTLFVLVFPKSGDVAVVSRVNFFQFFFNCEEAIISRHCWSKGAITYKALPSDILNVLSQLVGVFNHSNNPGPRVGLLGSNWVQMIEGSVPKFVSRASF